MKENSIKWFIGIILVIFIVFGGAMVLFQKQRYSKYYFDFNGYAVHRIPKQTGDVYSIEIFINDNPQPYLVNTRYNPRELAEIGVEEGIKESILSKKELFITMNSEASAISVLAATEISKVTGNVYLYNIPTYGALDAPVEGKNVTVMTCNDAVGSTGVIYLKEGGESKVYSDNNCVIIEGTDERDLVRVANRLMLETLGVF